MAPLLNPPAVIIDGRIGRDGIQPGGKRSARLEPVEILKHLQPNLLNTILHLRRIQHDPIANAMNPLDVPVIQPRGGFPVAPLRRLDQGLI